MTSHLGGACKKMMATPSSGGDGYMAPELRIERERSSLVLEELTNLLDGGAEVTKTRRRIRKHLDHLICLQLMQAAAM